MIDFVIPWVDGNDQTWLKKKREHDTKSDKTHSNSSMRFRDWGTLKYVLRSIEKNCPWYNKIYLITEGHYPKWLDVENDKIILITHEELYFDKTHLPTFSSSSIEMNLANIKGLSNKFVYMNDDTLIIKRLEERRFFIDEKPVDFVSHGWFPRNKIFEKLRGMNSWSHSIKNNINLINKKFDPLKFNKKSLYHNSYSSKIKISNFLLDVLYKNFLWLEHWHHPMPYLRSTLIDVHEEFHKEMMECSSNKFRKNNDLTQYLYRYWQLASGDFYPFKHNDGKYCKIENSKDIDKCLESIEEYTFFCPNDSISDGISEEENKYIEKKLIDKLEELFPNKALFEKEDR